jgi:Putative adhesin
MSWNRQVALALTTTVALAGGRVAAEDFDWHGRLSAGQIVEVKDVNGSIKAVAGGGSEVRVHAEKTGRRSDPSQVEIKVVEHANGVTLCAVYPTPSGSKPNECLPGSGGRMNTKDNDVQVEFTVQVPAGVGFVGRTVNGGVEASSLGGDVEAHTVNGGIRISTSGNARAETVNGSISASAGKADWSGAADFKTVNGSITVSLPDSASAEVHAQTVNGGIETDFPLTVKGKFSARQLSGTLGSGGRDLNLETVNGAIHLRRSN